MSWSLPGVVYSVHMCHAVCELSQQSTLDVYLYMGMSIKWGEYSTWSDVCVYVYTV